jgi:hypothetical protein
MSKHSFIVAYGTQTYIMVEDCMWVEIEVDPDEEDDDLEERIMDGEGDRFHILRGEVAK